MHIASLEAHTTLNIYKPMEKVMEFLLLRLKTLEY